MSRQPLPGDAQWTGIYKGDLFGNIYSAKNIDLERDQGRLVLGDSLTSKFDSGDDADLTLPRAFIRTAADGTDRWWVNGGKLFKTTNTNPEVGWTQDAITNSPSAPLWDLMEFVDDLMVPTATNIDKLSAGTWTNNWWSAQVGASALQTGVPHRLCIFSGAMLITDGRYINTWDGTLAFDPALTLPSNQEAQFCIPTASWVYICCKSLDGSDAEVFAWDRTSNSFNARFGVEDTEVLAGFAIAGIPYIITKRGEIKRFTGQGFRTTQQFPTVELRKEINNIDPNGVVVDNFTVKINVDFGVIADERLQSGIWTYSADTNNLYHSNSIRNDSGNDYSQQEVAGAGAMIATKPTQGRFLVGGTAYTNYSGSTKIGIFTFDEDSTSGQRGYIITPKLQSSDARRFWRQVFAKYSKFKSSTDRLYMMYRTQEHASLPAYETITWVNATSFTGANDNVSVGDYVEILAGDNAGAIVKITAIADGATNTYTIGESLNASTNSARVRYWNFKDLGSVSDQTSQEKLFRIAERAHWIQFLLELRGGINSPRFEQFLIDFDEIKY